MDPVRERYSRVVCKINQHNVNILRNNASLCTDSLMLLYETGIAAEPAEDAYGSGRKYKAGTPAQGVILGAGGRAGRNIP